MTVTPVAKVYYYLDLDPGEIWVFAAILVGLVGAAVIVLLRVRLAWLWVLLLSLLPLGVGYLARVLRLMEIRQILDAVGGSVSPEELEWALSNVNKPLVWAALGIPAVLGMGVVCHLSKPEPKRKPLTPSVPPAPPGAQTDWPDIQ